jgi:hypothetical protein
MKGKNQRIQIQEVKQVLSGRRGKREIIKHMWNGCSGMRETERKEREEIQNEDGRKIRWMQEKGKDREGQEWGKGKYFWNCYFYFVIRNPKARRALQRL